VTGVTDQLIAVHAPAVDVERHTPANAAIGSGVGVGFDGVFSLHAEKERNSAAIGISNLRFARFTIP
jgi:hypothetical protein